MGQHVGYLQGSKRPRRCEVKRLRMHDGGGKVKGRKQPWHEMIKSGPDGNLIRTTVG